MQRSLKRARRDLADIGVRCYGPDRFRLPGQTIQARFGFPFTKSARTDRRSPQEELAFLCKGCDRLVLSEENFIGTLNQPQGFAARKRYVTAERRVAALATAIGHDLDVFLAIRRPTGFMNAAYCQLLLGGQQMSIGAYLKDNPLSSVDWPDLVARLRATTGVGQLMVWRYEDYTMLFPQIVAGLVGKTAAHLVAPVARLIHPSLSEPAVAAVLQQDADRPLVKAGVAARRRFPVEEGHPPFDAFDADEHAMADAAYAAQVRAIAGMKGVTLLRPDSD